MIDKLFQKIIRFLPEPKTDLEIVLNKISKQDEVRNASIAMNSKGEVEEIDIDKNLNFMIGNIDYSCGVSFNYFSVRFGDNNTKCIVTTKKSKDPLFIFDDLKEVTQIRKAVIGKYHEMLDNKKLRVANV